jgi:ubiquinone/menaquinone biosynthesis C-methylase UbiE
LDFRNGKLTSFGDRTFDNVVCTEVLEHVPNQIDAISELCRVAKHTVIITVPFREKIQTVCCVHCADYTPYSGHLHAYDLNSFHALVPSGWHVAKQKSFGKRLTRHLVRLLRLDRIHSMPLVRALDFLFPGQGAWLLVVLERNKLNEQDPS